MPEDKEMKLLKTVECPIDYSSPQTILIEDKVDVNMYFTFKLVRNDQDKTCYTSYTVSDSSHGMIKIINAPLNSSTQTTNYIAVGTYQKKYNLFATYILYPKEQNTSRNLIVKFWIKEV